jgi:hypothetical protein
MIENGSGVLSGGQPFFKLQASSYKLQAEKGTTSGLIASGNERDRPVS